MAQLQITLSDLNELVSIGEQEAMTRLPCLAFPLRRWIAGSLMLK